MATTNYNLPEFTADGTPDLIGVYNAAMEAIDTKLKELSDSIANTPNLDAVKSDISSLKSSVSTINNDISWLKTKMPSTSDTSLTVAELNEAKLTAGGLIYYKKAQ